MSVLRPRRPCLVPWARLRRDPKTGHYVLLYPEKGLVLNDTSLQIVRRCNGDYTVAEIAALLATEHPGADTGRIANETSLFVEELSKRGLLQLNR